MGNKERRNVRRREVPKEDTDQGHQKKEGGKGGGIMEAMSGGGTSLHIL